MGKRKPIDNLILESNYKRFDELNIIVPIFSEIIIKEPVKSNEINLNSLEEVSFSCMSTLMFEPTDELKQLLVREYYVRLKLESYKNYLSK